MCILGVLPACAPKTKTLVGHWTSIRDTYIGTVRDDLEFKQGGACVLKSQTKAGRVHTGYGSYTYDGKRLGMTVGRATIVEEPAIRGYGKPSPTAEADRA